VAEDRNQNVKKQLLKKRDEAARRKVPLAPGEMVDDALARGMAGAGRWLKKNFGLLQWFIIACIVAGIGYGVYDYRAGKRAEAASAELIKGAVSERGRIVGASSMPKPEEEGIDDPTPVFKSAEERRDTALASYRKVTSSYPGTGAAILARLGEAGVLLDKRDWDGAIGAYRDVNASALAKVDGSVRGRALEGIGLALEGKGDTDGALKSFRELENTDARGLKELGMYHQARILFARGDADKAKELLKNARDHLKADSPSGKSDARPFSFLESQIDDLLRRVDPTAVFVNVPPAGGGEDPKSMTPEKLQRLQEQLQRTMKEAQEKASHDKGPTPTPPPPAGSP
jgi:tetratricopeptide (TPR) repeat protein